METRFTPGPWTPVAGQGAHHRDMYIRAGERKPDGTWPAVAKCCSTAIGARVVVESNARLISAAPDLYAACDELLRAARGELMGADIECAFARAESALAKAQGGA